MEPLSDSQENEPTPKSEARVTFERTINQYHQEFAQSHVDRRDNFNPHLQELIENLNVLYTLLTSFETSASLYYMNRTRNIDPQKITPDLKRLNEYRIFCKTYILPQLDKNDTTSIIAILSKLENRAD